MSKVSGGFDDAQAFWDLRFDTPEYVFGTTPNRFLVSQQALFRREMRVLDVATGEGRNAVWLAQQGCNVLGIDISPLGIAKAQRLAAQQGVAAAFEMADVRQWTWAAEGFGSIVS